MTRPEWVNDAWELDDVIADPVFQEFIDGLFECGYVRRITLLGSIVIGGREPFNRYPDKLHFIDIDVGVEYSSIPNSEVIPSHSNSGIETRGVAEYLIPYELKKCPNDTARYRPMVYVPSPNAPDSYYGKKYAIHIERAPYEQHVVLRER